MKVNEKIMLDFEGLCEHGPVNIVILGDSVSHGALLESMDYENVYWNLVKKKLNSFRDYIPVNMINSSIGGTTAEYALKRLENGVFNHNPDLVVVCFGLNDVNGEKDVYLRSLETIFENCIERKIDVIFMTPNMLNTYVAEDTRKDLLDYAAVTAQMQNEGKMDSYIYSAISLATDMNVKVCDCYSEWKKLSVKEDITKLLVNRINHPVSEMHKLFADKLYDAIMN